jgi:DNA transposition AAA+ family ATPase
MLESAIRVIDRQGLLKGDLNIVQRAGLQWLMNQEVDDQVELERLRIEYTALASHPGTQTKFLEALMKQRQLQETEVVYTESEWTTPQSMDEIERYLSTVG